MIKVKTATTKSCFFSIEPIYQQWKSLSESYDKSSERPLSKWPAALLCRICQLFVIQWDQISQIESSWVVSAQKMPTKKTNCHHISANLSMPKKIVGDLFRPAAMIHTPCLTSIRKTTASSRPLRLNVKIGYMKTLPNIEDRLVVHGMTGFDVRVVSVEWIPAEVDWLIKLDWGDHGSSRVWARDEGNTWYRFSTSN